MHSCTSVADGISKRTGIGNDFASNYGSVLSNVSTASRSSLLALIQSSLNESEVHTINFSKEDVMEAISELKSHKTDGSGVSTNHLNLVSPAVSKPLALFF